MDSEVAALFRRVGSILSIQSSKKARPNASDLASDILLNIFFLLRDMQPTFVIPAWDWVTLTKVCKRWRIVAVECPSLWSVICTNYTCHPERIRIFLERSEHVELEVDIKVDQTKGDDILDLFTDHMRRVREFKIIVMGVDFSRVKPLLQEMRECAKVLALRYKWRPFQSRLPLGTIDLPDALPLIRLNSLSLNSVALTWSSSLYYGLTEISIGTGDRMLFARPTIWQIIDVLEHCPNLRRLSLQNIFSQDTFNDIIIPQIEKRKLSLPQLSNIALVDMPFRLCEGLCSMFSFNEDALLYLSFNDYLFLTPYFFEALPPNAYIGRKKCAKISIIFNEKSFTLQSNYSFDSNGNSTSSDTIISLGFPHKLYSVQIMSAVAKLLQDPYWKTAEDVTISFEGIRIWGNYDMTVHSWIILLTGLPIITKSLTIKLPSLFDQTFEFSSILRGGIEVVLDLAGIGRPRLPNVKQLTMCSAGVPFRII